VSRGNRSLTRAVSVGGGRGADGGGSEGLGVLRDDITIKFLGSATKEFEEENEEDDADTGAGEHALGTDVPGAGDDCVSSQCTFT
jgi:hypothetical protein